MIKSPIPYIAIALSMIALNVSASDAKEMASKDASLLAQGSINTPVVLVSTTLVATAAAIISNVRGSSNNGDFTCMPGESMESGQCNSTTTTSTVTGTGTTTGTTTVTVTATSAL